MSRILVVDDEARIRQIIRKYAEFEGFEVEEAVDGMQAIEICRKEDFDLIIMDVMMPELDGFSACRKSENSRKHLSLCFRQEARSTIKFMALSLAVTTMLLSRSPKELMMRVNAVIKRSQGTQNEENVKKDVFTYEGLSVDFSARIVTIDGKRIEMTPKEYELFFYMVKNKGLALTREKLISEVWGYDFFGDERTLDTHIKLLRKSLGEYSRCIVTLRGWVTVLKQSNKRFDRHYLPLNFKLLCYFLLFGFAIVIVLWVFQTFFLNRSTQQQNLHRLKRTHRLFQSRLKKTKTLSEQLKMLQATTHFRYMFTIQLLFSH